MISARKMRLVLLKKALGILKKSNVKNAEAQFQNAFVNEGIKMNTGLDDKNVDGVNYPDFVDALTKDPAEVKKDFTAFNAGILHMAIGVSGEAGELLDAIKKTAIYRKEIDIENVKEELGDLEFYMQGLRNALGLSRDEILSRNVSKLSKRYPDASYSDNHAQKRLDKEMEK